MNVFYCPDAVVGTMALLSEQEAHHAVLVLRMKVGDDIYVFNGNGKLFSAVIASATKKEVAVHVKALLQEQTSNYFLHIAIAPTKQMERLEWLVEKATELGVSRITPVICQRSERKEVKIERLQKAAMAACKQSKQLVLPQIDEAVLLEQFVKADLPEHKFMAWCEVATNKVSSDVFSHTSVVFLIGPEGDFTSSEVTLATQYGFVPCSLGASILRTETAGVLVAAKMRR